MTHWYDGDFSPLLPLCAEVRLSLPETSRALSLIGRLEDSIRGARRAEVWRTVKAIEGLV